MNRREEPINIRARKKNNKEVRISTEPPQSSPLPAIRNLRGQNPAKRPHKVVEREAGKLLTLKKSYEIQKKKKTAPHSKRTTPGEHHSSTPSDVHKEGGRWMQTVEKQTLLRTKRLVNKMRKQKVKV